MVGSWEIRRLNPKIPRMHPSLKDSVIFFFFLLTTTDMLPYHPLVVIGQSPNSVEVQARLGVLRDRLTCGVNPGPLSTLTVVRTQCRLIRTSVRRGW
jgi:hypothetical protein